MMNVKLNRKQSWINSEDGSFDTLIASVSLVITHN